MIILRFDMEKEFDKHKEVMDKLLVEKDNYGKIIDGSNSETAKARDKYVITRYFQNKEAKDDVRYMVFEKIK